MCYRQHPEDVDMEKELKIQLADMVTCLSDAVDLVSSRVARQHKRVAIMGRAIASEMGMDESSINTVVLAGMVHDIGALTLKERLDLLLFEEKPGDMHAERGYFMLGLFEPFARIAEIVRYHHHPWLHGGEMVPVESHIIHLADRVAVRISDSRELISQADSIRAAVSRLTPTRFAPSVVEAFMKASLRDEFWTDLVVLDLNSRFERLVEPLNVYLDEVSLLGLASMFGVVVDYRSRFTAQHTAAVTAVAESMGRIMGLDEDSLWKVRLAANLHDLGMLAVPVEVLDKPGKLTPEESTLMRRHSYYTHSLLSRLPGMEEVSDLASLHHERLDGKGYPFHRNAEGLPLGARIVSVADVFAALTEDRPYRPGLEPHMAMWVLERMTVSGALDGRVVKALRKNMKEVDGERNAAREPARRRYEDFRRMSRMAA